MENINEIVDEIEKEREETAKNGVVIAANEGQKIVDMTEPILRAIRTMSFDELISYLGDIDAINYKPANGGFYVIVALHGKQLKEFLARQSEEEGREIILDNYDNGCSFFIKEVSEEEWGGTPPTCQIGDGVLNE